MTRLLKREQQSIRTGNTKRGKLASPPRPIVVLQQETTDSHIPPWVVNHATYRK